VYKAKIKIGASAEIKVLFDKCTHNFRTFNEYLRASNVIK